MAARAAERHPSTAGHVRQQLPPPLPPALAARLAKGYGLSLKPGAFEWDLLGPADAFSSTAKDMTRFMMAYLNGERLGAVRILGKEAVVRNAAAPVQQPVGATQKTGEKTSEHLYSLTEIALRRGQP
jgi:CubicO group peptidase (beta-lactamase class C family)